MCLQNFSTISVKIRPSVDKNSDNVLCKYPKYHDLELQQPREFSIESLQVVNPQRK